MPVGEPAPMTNRLAKRSGDVGLIIGCWRDLLTVALDKEANRDRHGTRQASLSSTGSDCVMRSGIEDMAGKWRRKAMAAHRRISRQPSSSILEDDEAAV